MGHKPQKYVFVAFLGKVGRKLMGASGFAADTPCFMGCAGLLICLGGLELCLASGAHGRKIGESFGFRQAVQGEGGVQIIIHFQYLGHGCALWGICQVLYLPRSHIWTEKVQANAGF
ncbi:hypothetical protein J7413_19685 [Shimia sp. R10_1]|uniref:hypothetical protein n=1 Tax=Shimia sp. R10_1 TaxID=2821095 RepID=UPI001ADC2E87|nr:hypothetical protein [Shimia sp. R10_1]MBO9475763.1 hypothetical protein [Shimia sp. R10_1]